MTVEVTKLKNGLRIVSESRSSVETVSVGFWIDVGSRHETLKLNGITHFLEHMLFKGTKTRSAKDIVLEIEAVGGHMNAYTTRDNTTYYARVLKNDLPLAVDILCDMLRNSLCASSDVEREKEVILQEVGQALDTPDDVVFDNLQAAAYSNQAIGRSILGEVANIKSFTQDDLLGYLQSNYSASNIVVSAVGNLKHKDLVSLVESKLADLPTGTGKTPEPASYTGGRKIESRELEQVHYTAAWPSYSYHDDNYYAMQVYSTILGGGMSSRLFQEVREHRGLAYSVYSFTSSHADTGMFGLYAGTSPDMVEEMVPVIKGEMEKLAAGPESVEFKVAIAQLKASLMMALEATTSRMEQLGRQQLVFNRVIPVEEMIANVEAVELDHVQKIAMKICDTEQPTLAIVGPGTYENLGF